LSRKHVLAFLSLLMFAGSLYLARQPLQRFYYGVKYQGHILQAAQDTQLDPHLIAGLIYTESRFRTQARSDVGAVGLMQLMPETAQEVANYEGEGELDSDSLADPGTNIKLGSRYLRYLLDRFGEEEIALAAYNAGPTQVDDWRREGPEIGYPETRAYIENVLYYRDRFRILYPEWGKGL